MNKASFPFPIVGIGASAGGLSPIQEFFDYMPSDSGLAFVIVQHLSPDFKSLMDELLARHTEMKIHKVTDGIDVQPNSVYLIPPGENMMLSQGTLLLSKQTGGRGLNLPIDIFFSSLAEGAGEQAIAVVLSGTGSDGSRGIVDVRERGGVIFVQDPDSAAFDGMPLSAAQSGVVDAMLPPQEIPDRILSYVKDRDRSQLVAPQEMDIGIADSSLVEIIRLFRLQFGIDFALYKQGTINRRIIRRMKLVGCPSLGEYVSRLKSDQTEVEHLYRDLLIEVTQFFRDRAAFDRLRTTIIPEVVLASDPEIPIRVWVPGCATGEEAYTIAMLFDEAIRFANRQQDFKVFATDVHRDSLETASNAAYPEKALNSVSSDFAQRYFQRSSGICHIRRELRQKVIFAASDITNDPPFTRIDLISCRNVLIYLEPRVQKRVLSLFHFGLKVGGVLFLGPSETVGDLASEFETIDRHWRIYSKRRDVRLPDAQRMPIAPMIQSVVKGTTQGVVTTSLRSTAGGDYWVSRAMEDLLAKHVPPSLIINDLNELIHSFGEARKFLVQPEGSPTLDALKMMPTELKTAVSAALHRVRQHGEPVAFNSVKFQLDDQQHACRVRVEQYGRTNNALYLICIEPVSPPEEITTPGEDYRVEEYSGERVSELESELNYTRETLQSTVEELESSNEELQATNEELIASNEELQSTNEELQSVNEENYSVNVEYQRKVQELEEMSQDLDAFLSSSDIGTLFLDSSLRIRRFTEAVQRYFDLLPHDVGRPVQNFANRLQYPDFFDTIQRVNGTGATISAIVNTESGPTLVRIAACTNHDGLSGVVVNIVSQLPLKDSLGNCGLTRPNESGIWEWPDVRQDDMWWSPACLELLQYDQSDLTQSMSTWKSMVHPEDQHRLENAGSSQCEFVKNGFLNIRMRCGDGEYRPFEYRGFFRYDEAGNPKRISGTVSLSDEVQVAVSAPTGVDAQDG